MIGGIAVLIKSTIDCQCHVVAYVSCSPPSLFHASQLHHHAKTIVATYTFPLGVICRAPIPVLGVRQLAQESDASLRWP